jgi:hypothetical protein
MSEPKRTGLARPPLPASTGRCPERTNPIFVRSFSRQSGNTSSVSTTSPCEPSLTPPVIEQAKLTRLPSCSRASSLAHDPLLRLLGRYHVLWIRKVSLPSCPRRNNRPFEPKSSLTRFSLGHLPSPGCKNGPGSPLDEEWRTRAGSRPLYVPFSSYRSRSCAHRSNGLTRLERTSVYERCQTPTVPTWVNFMPVDPNQEIFHPSDRETLPNHY